MEVGKALSLLAIGRGGDDNHVDITEGMEVLRRDHADSLGCRYIRRRGKGGIVAETCRAVLPTERRAVGAPGKYLDIERVGNIPKGNIRGRRTLESVCSRRGAERQVARRRQPQAALIVEAQIIEIRSCDDTRARVAYRDFGRRAG